MRVITDWHLHSRFSRACSKDLTLENNALWCAKKGVDVLGTADFTHPKWFAEIKDKLVEDQPGLYRMKGYHKSTPSVLRYSVASERQANSPLERGRGTTEDVRFMMTTEVAQIYRKDDRCRRIHNIIFAPSIEAVEKINKWLSGEGFNLKSDGRPILGIDSEELYKNLKDIDDRIIIIPAHAWTPWFSVFGSKSGFDTLEQCFGEMTKYIYAVETGLSSDPLMNRSLSMLDDVMLISNSDAHSPRNFGREANVFELEEKDLSYDTFIDILKNKDISRFKYTIEFYPEEGKYHADGCSNCGFWCLPEQTKKLGGKCKICKKPMTIGVLARVSELSDRLIKSMPKNQVPFKSIVPLQEIIAESFGVKSTSSKKVQAMYEKMIVKLGSEFDILLDVSIDAIKYASDEVIAEGISRMRTGNIHIRPGYDGIFGEVKIFTNKASVPKAKQDRLI
ncbi:endonuclease Q family protein [Patescibacteria group bacterium]|nr:endonuclease Q family protein [Patescibacteria group bacterium]MCG2687421.1 endonuclease Q family protein [Candidatus Parcubacteria bacterium]